MGQPDPAPAAGAGGSRLAHIPALDGLRGAAVLAVLWFHAGHLTGGYLGVDLFFVLSGYLITRLLLVEWGDTGRIDLVAFWGRRARRLLPALFALLVVVGIAARTEVLSTSREALRGMGLATLGYVANWYAIVSGDGYWDRALTPSWLEHTWSLAIEEQFYLLWPLVVVGLFALWARRVGRSGTIPPDPDVVTGGTRALAWVCGLGALASAALMIGWSLAGGDPERLYLGTDTRVAAILLGAWAACIQRSHGPVGEAVPARRALAGASLLGAGVLALAWTRLDGSGTALYRGGLLACGLAATAVVLDVTNPGPSPVGRILAWTPLRWVGTISYGLYLWHWPVYRYLHPGRFGIDGWANTALRVAMSFAVAVASFVLLERPIRERRWRVPLLRLLPVGIGLAVVALLVGTSGALDPVVSGDRTTSSVGPKGAPQVMVVGDSGAFAIAEEGLIPEAEAGRSGLAVADRSSIGCTLMRDIDDPVDDVIGNCSPAWPADVAEVDPDVVLVLFGGYVSIVPMPIDGVDAWPCEPAYDQRWRERLEGAVDVLSAEGATVLLATAPTTWSDQVRGEHGAAFDERQACANEVIEAVAAARPEAGLVDLARWTCPPDQGCRTELDGVELRPDGVHFKGEGAVLVARWLAPQLTAAAR